MLNVLANEATAARRRVYFFIRLSADHVSPASKNGGQPQISTNGGAWTNTGISALTEVGGAGSGNGEHYADLTQAAIATAGDRIRARYRDPVDTDETRSEEVVVVGYNQYSSTDLGLANLASLRVKKNTALNGFPFLMIDSTNHVSGKTGLTVTPTRMIDGGAFAPAFNTVVEKGNGAYVLDIAASDLNGNAIMFRFAAPGADDTFVSIMTQT